jgi:hypothetical protein
LNAKKTKKYANGSSSPGLWQALTCDKDCIRLYRIVLVCSGVIYRVFFGLFDKYLIKTLSLKDKQMSVTHFVSYLTFLDKNYIKHVSYQSCTWLYNHTIILMQNNKYFVGRPPKHSRSSPNNSHPGTPDSTDSWSGQKNGVG